MKSWKITFVSFFLSISTVGIAYTQTAPRLAFSLNSGITKSGLPIKGGFRIGLGHHLALNTQLGNNPWRRESLGNRRIAQDVTLREVNIKGRMTFSFDVRAFTNANQSGLYGGVGYMRQVIQVETITKIDRPELNSNFAGGARTVGGFLVGLFFDALLNSSTNRPIVRREDAKINALTIDAGYAHVMRNNQRLEFGLRFFNRNLDGLQYTVPTKDRPKMFDISDVANAQEITFELRYVLPIL